MNLRTINDHLAFPIFLVLCGILALLYPRREGGPAACFGERNQLHAQRGAEAWVRNRPADSAWAAPPPRDARVRCLPVRPGTRWAECHIGPVDPSGSFIVVDCDTAERNNLGCVSGR